MRAVQIWKAAVEDTVDFLDELIDLLRNREIRFCVIGGQGVNAYAEPLISLDLDLVVAAHQIEEVQSLLDDRFEVERFPYSLNISGPGSNLRVQIQTDPRYFAFPDRAATRDVLGIDLPVARIDDVLQGKVWAASDPTTRPSKRRKDLLDIERLIESHPDIRKLVPTEILKKLSEE
jgi:hypothetical protein